MNKYGMIQDIIDVEKITDKKIKDALRLAYFRGLSHSHNKDEILEREFMFTMGYKDKWKKLHLEMNA